MSTFRFLLAVFVVAVTPAAHSEPKVSIGTCGDADILLEFKGATAKHPLIEELSEAMKERSAVKFAYNSIEGGHSSPSRYLRDRRTKALHPVGTDDYKTLRCTEKRGETYLMMAMHCGGSGCVSYGNRLLWVNRWRYLTRNGELSAKATDCEWQRLVQVLGAAFEIEDEAIATLLETGDIATFDTPPKKKRRLPANTLPKGKECETIGAIYEECVEAQRDHCSDPADFNMKLSNASRGNYYAIAELNKKFDSVAFEAACFAVCSKGRRPLTQKAITAKFCG